ncbi:tRNA glutamyl-Q(34) synthetase GluQRS [Delftia sp. PS-11]|uniref:tRNA glutamyl-Q(34) synthetase GluQRS n=1 Tax=Delftia sp. PS-11 TaxID=2767222 RepID=UPI0024567846|nr:tRNA glutamyl-Q(34) synthetase GluQRS [Delftia sp. PS-11]KAJ8744629.1 tRNA glutamyl-Q(34) synthetase GluQRS [Delftia sp. PS-11]
MHCDDNTPSSPAPASGGYVGRFAPSPTGLLHAGSLVAALASWLDARAHGGRWLVRIEDIDPPRCQTGADAGILRQLAACGLLPDEAPVWQSQRHTHYEHALQQLKTAQLAYACGCTRKDIEAEWTRMGLVPERHVERPYPGTCRRGLHGKTARAWRFALARFTEGQSVVHWHDRRLGAQQQDVICSVGDFVLRRADGLWAYQLAVVVDDALQGVTHVVRGEDLTDNTPRQLLLQQALGLAAPLYLHTPLVRMADGEKLSKQHGAPALDLSDPLAALSAAASHLGLPHAAAHDNLADALQFWVRCWRHTYN